MTVAKALQQGTSSSEPVPLGTSHVHMQTSPSVQQIEHHPPQACAVAQPLPVPTVPGGPRLFVLVQT